MVTAVVDAQGRSNGLVLRPHAPLGWLGTLLLFCLVDTPIIGIAVICGLLGTWYVLPFSLAVVAAVGAGLVAGYWRTQRCEVVAIDEKAIAIDKGHRRPEQHFEFPRGWTQVVLEHAPTGDERASHLYIRAHGQQVEVGDFLEEAERRSVAERLRLVVAVPPHGSEPAVR